jgi:hypothetical protein
MINILSKTWKAPRLKGFKKLIQQQNEQLLLTYLLAASINDEASFATKSELLKAIDDLRTYATVQLKATTDTSYKGHLLLILERMKSPEKQNLPTSSTATRFPIGCGEE